MARQLVGIHDPFPLNLYSHHTGWCIASVDINSENPEQWRRTLEPIHNAGHQIIVRLNHGYHPRGTIPEPEYYRSFANSCALYIHHFPFVHRWIIGNEPNLEIERPQGQPITPENYAECFNLCRERIRRQSGHLQDELITAAVAPWNLQTGHWLDYQRRVLELTDPDGIAIHTYSRGSSPNDVWSEARMDSMPEHYAGFRAYRDLMNAIPQSRRHLPVYLTETNQNQPWRNENTGWVQAAAGEIDWWNRQPGNQRIHCLALYRWQAHDEKVIQGKAGVIEDFKQAVEKGYSVPEDETTEPSPDPEPEPDREPEPQEDGDREWDPRLDERGAVLVPAEVKPGLRYLRLVEAEWYNEQEADELGPDHHILIDVLDEEGNRAVGIQFAMVNGGRTNKVTEKKSGQLWALDFPMFNAGHPYSIEPITATPADKVQRLGLGSVERPDWNIHTSYRFVWQWTTAPDASGDDSPHHVYLPSVHGPTPQGDTGANGSGQLEPNGEDTVSANIDGKVRRIARLLRLEPVVLQAVLNIEAGGRYFNSDDSLVIRFEPHIFWNLWGKEHPDEFAAHFRGQATWQGNDDRYALTGHGEWLPIHVSQSDEWAAFRLAVGLFQADGIAQKCISMGAPQIMGFNAGVVGYGSAQEMLDSFQASALNQVIGFALFLDGKNLVDILRRREFHTFARIYNGIGQAERYAALIEAELARLGGEG